jgi:nucleotide-binding universal stress UspA family protein
MNMKILVALDGSDAAFNAMRSACRLAAKTGSYITAFYVNQGVAYSPEETAWSSIKERISRELETAGHEVIRKAYQFGNEFSVPVEGIISDGIPAPEILRYAAAHGIIKLIVMGHSSKGKSAQEFVASTTRNMVENAKVPVFVTNSELDVKSILLAVDDSASSRNAAAFGGTIAQSLGADLSVISIIPDAEADINEYTRIAEVPNIDRYIEASERDLTEIVERTLSSTKEILASMGMAAAPVVKKGQITDELLSEAKKHDLLVIGARRGSFQKKLARTTIKLLETRSVNVVFVQ